MDRRPYDALDVLRQVWSAEADTSTPAPEIDDNAGFTKACKRMSNVGFGGFADADEDLRTAWRSRLEREGKLGASSIRDLVLGPESAR